MINTGLYPYLIALDPGYMHEINLGTAYALLGASGIDHVGMVGANRTAVQWTQYHQIRPVMFIHTKRWICDTGTF